MSDDTDRNSPKKTDWKPVEIGAGLLAGAVPALGLAISTDVTWLQVSAVAMAATFLITGLSLVIRHGSVFSRDLPSRSKSKLMPAVIFAVVLLLGSGLALAATRIWDGDGDDGSTVPLVENFKDTLSWRLTSDVRPFREGESGYLRFVPIERLVSRAFRNYDEGISLTDYSSIQLRVRLNHQGESPVDITEDAIIYFVQADTRYTVSLANYIEDVDSTEWQTTMPIPLFDFRPEGDAEVDKDGAISQLGLEFEVDQRGVTIDIDDITFLPD